MEPVTAVRDVVIERRFEKFQDVVSDTITPEFAKYAIERLTKKPVVKKIADQQRKDEQDYQIALGTTIDWKNKRLQMQP